MKAKIILIEAENVTGETAGRILTDLLSSLYGASEAQPPEAVSPSANCSARPSAVAPKDSLITSVVPREKAEPATIDCKSGGKCISRDCLKYGCQID